MNTGHADVQDTTRTDRITAGEITKVCARYDLGTVTNVRKLSAGSRAAPKVLVITDRAGYVLKRRPEHVEPAHVAASHELLIHLARAGVPVARLVGTRADNRSMLLLDGAVYEVFAFVPGTRYDRSEPATIEAGRVLAQTHEALGAFAPTWPVPEAGYHGRPDINAAMGTIRKRLPAREVRRLTRALTSTYYEAAAQVDALSYQRLPVQMIHADWHAGNLLYNGSEVAVVLDFDGVLRAPTPLDLANGLLQFSLIAAGPTPSAWPAHQDVARTNAFFRGYTSGMGVPSPVRSMLPWLMIESLIVEIVATIGQTGRFAGADGPSVLAFAERKTGWLVEAGARLIDSWG